MVLLGIIGILKIIAVFHCSSADPQVIPMERPPNLLPEAMYNPFFPAPLRLADQPPLPTTAAAPTMNSLSAPGWDPNLPPFLRLQQNRKDVDATPSPLFRGFLPPSNQLFVPPPPPPPLAPFPSNQLLFPPPPPPPPSQLFQPPVSPMQRAPFSMPSQFMKFRNFSTSTLKSITIDPEAVMSVPEIVRYWGYPVETHEVVTEDGYVLTLHRIPHGKNDSDLTAYRPVVFLQHGLLCTSSMWLLNLPHQSAGFLFADRGFDVWLGNMRGNSYSKKHVQMDSESADFWRFSWQDMAEYDLPAMIDYVLNVTDQPSLYYVGHSQGTLTMFAKLSKDQEFAKKIRKFFALAPVSRMSNVKGLFYYLGQIYQQFRLVYRVFGDNEFMSNNIFTSLLTEIICDNSLNNMVCENVIFAVSGPNSNQFNSSRIGIYLAHNPAGTSTRNMLHFAQMVNSKRMASFDRGPEANVRWYGDAFPPEYDLTQVHSDIYLFYSDYDWLASAADVEGFLIPALPKTSVKFARRLQEFNHNDFLWGLRARKEIYDPISNIIKIDTRRQLIQRSLKSYFNTRSPSLKVDPNDVSSNRPSLKVDPDVSTTMNNTLEAD